MGCGIEPRKIIRRRGRGFSFARRQHVRHRYARCCRPAGVKGHITCKGIAPEPGRSHVWPSMLRERDGPHREGEETSPMMHGHEKTEPAIVVMKPANKAEGPSAARPAEEKHAAESVERRAGTKGNADQQSTHRTQRRHRVAQALECIRKVASTHFAVTHPRWEPDAGKPHVRICAGGARQLASLPLQRRDFFTPRTA